METGTELQQVRRWGRVSLLGTDWTSNRRRAVLLFLLVAAPACLVGMASTDVFVMEGIVADAARAMARTGEYAVPRLHGEIYTYKPPLAYWLVLASFETFGQETAWTLRFPFAASAVLMGLVVLLVTGRLVGAQAALLCALAALSSSVTVQKLHRAEFDILLAATVGAAIVAACRNLSTEKASRHLWLFCYLALALGFLTKGAPALQYFVPGLLLAVLCTNRFKELWTPGHLTAVVVFLLIVSAWVVAAYQAEGWAAFEQPIAEARDKGMTWSIATLAETAAKPFALLILFLPWSLLLPLSFKGEWPTEPVRRLAITSSSFIFAGLVASIVVPVFEPRYLLPLTVPVGILCGTMAVHGPRPAGLLRRRLIQILAAAIAIGAFGLALTADAIDAASRLVVMSIAVVTLVVAVRDMRRRLGPLHIWLLAGIAILGWVVQVRGVEPHRSSSRSLRGVASAFDAHLASAPVVWTGPVSKDYHHSSLFFYLDRPVKTFTAAGHWPGVGDYVVLFGDEHPAELARPPFEAEVVEREVHRNTEFVLLRVTGPSDSGYCILNSTAMPEA